MSENTGPMTFERYRVKPGTVGRTLPGTELEIFPDGEVCCRGGHVFQGYLNDPEKTAEAIDEDGWLHSGDIGEIDEDGYLRIVDRKKELIITAGGKNISPANLEAALKMIPLVAQAAAIGDNRPFVSALVALDPEVAPVWATNQGIEFDDLADLATKVEVVEAINNDLDKVMSEFNNAERVKKVHILGEEWLPDSDVLDPDLEAQAAWHPRPLRDRDRGALHLSGCDPGGRPSSASGVERRDERVERLEQRRRAPSRRSSRSASAAASAASAAPGPAAGSPAAAG